MRTNPHRRTVGFGIPGYQRFPACVLSGLYRPLMASALALAGCAVPLVATPGSDVTEITDNAALMADESVCQSYALAYRKGFSVTDVASAAAIGGLQNAPAAAVNPLVPVIGAAGGAGTAVVSWLDLIGANRACVFWTCLREKSRVSRAYLVLEPRCS